MHFSGLSFAASACKSKRVDRSKANVRKSHQQIRPNNYIAEPSGEQTAEFLVPLRNFRQVVICLSRYDTVLFFIRELLSSSILYFYCLHDFIGIVIKFYFLFIETKSHTGPLVVVISAIENVPASVLREFVQITSMRVRESRGLPIFFVFGLTSTEDLVLESHCDAQTLSCLITKRFRMQPPSVALDAVFTEV